jgi:hypothetical protein
VLCLFLSSKIITKRIFFALSAGALQLKEFLKKELLRSCFSGCRLKDICALNAAINFTPGRNNDQQIGFLDLSGENKGLS